MKRSRKRTHQIQAAKINNKYTTYIITPALACLHPLLRTHTTQQRSPRATHTTTTPHELQSTHHMPVHLRRRAGHPTPEDEDTQDHHYGYEEDTIEGRRYKRKAGCVRKSSLPNSQILDQKEQFLPLSLFVRFYYVTTLSVLQCDSDIILASSAWQNEEQRFFCAGVMALAHLLFSTEPFIYSLALLFCISTFNL